MNKLYTFIIHGHLVELRSLVIMLSQKLEIYCSSCKREVNLEENKPIEWVESIILFKMSLLRLYPIFVKALNFEFIYRIN